ncbi:MAG: peptide deformylase [Microgenomates group bacterium]
MFKIITVPNPLLRQKSEPVNNLKEANKIIDELKETLVKKEGSVAGVGLAAVQIGIPKKVFLAYSKASKKFLSFINPEIIWYSKKQTNTLRDNENRFEGCLSVPNKWSVIRRARKIKVVYQTQTGQKITRTFSDQLATIIQHEYDHLNGILFIDRAIEQGAKIYELVKDEEGKEFLKEIKL